MTKNEKSIMKNRIAILTDLNYIVSLAESQIVRVRGMPVTNNADVADVVQGYADRVHEIMQDLYDLRNSKRLNLEGVDVD